MSNLSFHATLHQHLQTMCNGFNLDMIERVLAERPEIQCNVRTDIGQPKAPSGPAKARSVIVWMATADSGTSAILRTPRTIPIGL